jgi:SAM-dependent methyltransferase
MSPNGSDGDPLLDPVMRYYTEKLREHGASFRGVDWNSEESQRLRFEQFLTLLPPESKGANVADYGCGYGALLDFLRSKRIEARYEGIDISADMVRAAARLHGECENHLFRTDTRPLVPADYGFASGIFNVRLDVPFAEWRQHILFTLTVINDHSRRGFAFNCLTDRADKDRIRPDLHYESPAFISDWCRNNCSTDTRLLEDYGLFEFTVIVRKGQ